MLTQHIAVQYGLQGVRCNAITPGVIMSEQAKVNSQDLVRAIKDHMLRDDRMGVEQRLLIENGGVYSPTSVIKLSATSRLQPSPYRRRQLGYAASRVSKSICGHAQ